MAKNFRINKFTDQQMNDHLFSKHLENYYLININEIALREDQIIKGKPCTNIATTGAIIKYAFLV